MDASAHPALPVFVACAAILVLKMAVVGHLAGALRFRRRAYLNPEDAAAFGGQPRNDEHPDVARALRAHRNDLESTLPFLAVGIPYLLTGPPAALASGLFAAFTALRLAFSVFYLRAWQPWRTLSFVAAEACLLVMLAQMLWWGVQALAG